MNLKQQQDRKNQIEKEVLARFYNFANQLQPNHSFKQPTHQQPQLFQNTIQQPHPSFHQTRNKNHHLFNNNQTNQSNSYKQINKKSPGILKIPKNNHQHTQTKRKDKDKNKVYTNQPYKIMSKQKDTSIIRQLSNTRNNQQMEKTNSYKIAKQNHTTDRKRKQGQIFNNFKMKKQDYLNGNISNFESIGKKGQHCKGREADLKYKMCESVYEDELIGIKNQKKKYVNEMNNDKLIPNYYQLISK